MFRNLFDNPLQLLIVVLVIVVLVGWKKLPDVARSLGRSMRILKSEVEEMKHDGKATPSAASSDTVKGDTIKDDVVNDETRDPIADPTGRHTAEATTAADAAEPKTHNQPPV